MSEVTLKKTPDNDTTGNARQNYVTVFNSLFRRYGTAAIFLLLIVVASFQSDVFLTERNMMNVFRQMSGVGIMAIGMLFVILTRGIDLSVGSIAALGAVSSALLIQSVPVAVAIPLVLLFGAACGAVSGFFIAMLRMPAFVITLAMMTAARGLALILSNGQPIMPGPAGESLQQFGTSFTLGLPNPAWLMIALFALAFLVLNFSRFGRLVKAVGSNEEAVRLSGISVPLYVMAVYVISGALAAIAGVLVTARSGVGSASVGTGQELDVIAAVVIGGASLMGGWARRSYQYIHWRDDFGCHRQHHEPRRGSWLSPASVSGPDHCNCSGFAKRQPVIWPPMSDHHCIIKQANETGSTRARPDERTRVRAETERPVDTCGVFTRLKLSSATPTRT